MNLHPTQRLLLLAAAVTLSACAARSPTPDTPVRRDGDVGYEAVALDDNNRLTVAPVRFTNADPPVGAQRILPIYPPALLAMSLPPLTRCAELWIDADGVVNQVHSIVQPPDCPGTEGQPSDAFDDAIEVAVRQWDFLPAFVCEDQPDGSQDFECNGNGKQRYIPIRLTFRFLFKQVEGAGVVTEVGRH